MSFKVPPRGPKKGTKKDIFDEETIKKCECVARPPGTKSKSMVINLLEVLIIANEDSEKMKEEIVSLKEENIRLKEGMKKE